MANGDWSAYPPSPFDIWLNRVQNAQIPAPTYPTPSQVGSQIGGAINAWWNAPQPPDPMAISEYNFLHNQLVQKPHLRNNPHFMAALRAAGVQAGIHSPTIDTATPVAAHRAADIRRAVTPVSRPLQNVAPGPFGGPPDPTGTTSGGVSGTRAGAPMAFPRFREDPTTGRLIGPNIDPGFTRPPSALFPSGQRPGMVGGFPTAAAPAGPPTSYQQAMQNVWQRYGSDPTAFFHQQRLADEAWAARRNAQAQAQLANIGNKLTLWDQNPNSAIGQRDLALAANQTVPFTGTPQPILDVGNTNPALSALQQPPALPPSLLGSYASGIPPLASLRIDFHKPPTPD